MVEEISRLVPCPQCGELILLLLMISLCMAIQEFNGNWSIKKELFLEIFLIIDQLYSTIRLSSLVDYRITLNAKRLMSSILISWHGASSSRAEIFQNLGMITVFLRWMEALSLSLEAMWQDLEQMNVISAQRMEELWIGNVLVKTVHLSQLHVPLKVQPISTENFMYSEEWMTIVVNSMIYGSLIFRQRHGKRLSFQKDHLHRVQEVVIVQAFTRTKCTSLEVSLS